MNENKDKWLVEPRMLVTFLLIVAAITLALGIIMMPFGLGRTIFGKSRDAKQSKAKGAELILALLPSDTNGDTNLFPIPIIRDFHIGGEWILARGQGSHYTIIVYVPSTVTMRSITFAPVDPMGRIDPRSDMVAYEIMAENRVNKGGVETVEFSAFRLLAITDREPLFMHANPQQMEYLKSRMTKR